MHYFCTFCSSCSTGLYYVRIAFSFCQQVRDYQDSCVVRVCSCLLCCYFRLLIYFYFRDSVCRVYVCDYALDYFSCSYWWSLVIVLCSSYWDLSLYYISLFIFFIFLFSQFTCSCRSLFLSQTSLISPSFFSTLSTNSLIFSSYPSYTTLTFMDVFPFSTFLSISSWYLFFYSLTASFNYCIYFLYFDSSAFFYFYLVYSVDLDMCLLNLSYQVRFRISLRMFWKHAYSYCMLWVGYFMCSLNILKQSSARGEDGLMQVWNDVQDWNDDWDDDCFYNGGIGYLNTWGNGYWIYYFFFFSRFYFNICSNFSACFVLCYTYFPNLLLIIYIYY